MTVKGEFAMSDEYGFSYAKENCIQCHACEVACKSWRGVETGIRYRRVENIWQGSYPEVKCFSASIACMHCLDPACVNACPEGAISKRTEDGAVIVDRDKCVGCRTCLEICPFEAPTFGSDGKMRKCDMCLNEIDFKTESPPCVATCPTGALGCKKIDIESKRAMEETIKQLVRLIDR